MAAMKSERALVEQWHDVRALHARTTCELDRELHQYGLGASDFEVLDRCARSVCRAVTAPRDPAGVGGHRPLRRPAGP
ncbi:hypothetical protein ABZZ38_30080, partial [Streptomyces sp. NPDC006368]